MKANTKFYLKYKEIVDKDGFFSCLIDKTYKRIVFFTWNEKFIDVDLIVTITDHREEGENITYRYDRNGFDRDDRDSKR